MLFSCFVFLFSLPFALSLSLSSCVRRVYVLLFVMNFALLLLSCQTKFLPSFCCHYRSCFSLILSNTIHSSRLRTSTKFYASFGSDIVVKTKFQDPMSLRSGQLCRQIQTLRACFELITIKVSYTCFRHLNRPNKCVRDVYKKNK